MLSPLYPELEVDSLYRIIMREVCGYTSADIILYKSTTLSPNKRHEIGAIVDRMAQGEPLQYVLGYTSFHDFDFKVARGVLIPRPETAELVQLIVDCHRGRTGVKVLDIGTGSGCIAISLALMLTEAQVEAWDISEQALEIACENASRNRAKVKFRRQDALSAWPEGHELLDVIVSNPPYVCDCEQEAMHTNVLTYEPHLALFVPDSDPLLFYRAIATQGFDRLKQGGQLYFEINQAFGEEMVQLLTVLGYQNVELRKDLFGRDRFIKGTKT